MIDIIGSKVLKTVLNKREYYILLYTLYPIQYYKVPSHYNAS